MSMYVVKGTVSSDPGHISVLLDSGAFDMSNVQAERFSLHLKQTITHTPYFTPLSGIILVV